MSLIPTSWEIDFELTIVNSFYKKKILSTLIILNFNQDYFPK